MKLLQVEGEEPKPDISAYTDEQQIYHSALLIEAGLVDGEIIKDRHGHPAETIILRLSWAGHEFLDAARSDTIWRKASEHIEKSGANVTLSILQEVLKQLAKQSLGLP